MKDTDESVFPTGIKMGEESTIGGGMTLRDWFAGQALIGFNRPEVRQKYAQYIKAEKIANAISRVCYEQADAMMKERKK